MIWQCIWLFWNGLEGKMQKEEETMKQKDVKVKEETA